MVSTPAMPGAELGRWLADLGAAESATAFIRAGYTSCGMAVAAKLSQEDLRRMGLRKLKVRKAVYNALRDLGREPSPTPLASPANEQAWPSLHVSSPPLKQIEALSLRQKPKPPLLGMPYQRLSFATVFTPLGVAYQRLSFAKLAMAGFVQLDDDVSAAVGGLLRSAKEEYAGTPFCDGTPRKLIDTQGDALPWSTGNGSEENKENRHSHGGQPPDPWGPPSDDGSAENASETAFGCALPPVLVALLAVAAGIPAGPRVRLLVVGVVLTLTLRLLRRWMCWLRSSGVLPLAGATASVGCGHERERPR